MVNIGVISLGCPKNRIDTELMLGYILNNKNYSLVTDESKADVIIINTCGFIDEAKTEAIDTILEAAKYKKTGNLKKLIVTGCLSKRYNTELASEMPEVDAILGINQYHKIVEIIDSINNKQLIDTEGELYEYNYLQRVITTPPHYAYIRIADGCNNFCSFCAIPYIRGRYNSRKIEDILHEAQMLIDKGVKEIILVAQDTTRYGIDIYGEPKLKELLEKLSDMDIKWLRLLYAYPETLTDDLLDLMAQKENICKYIDMPIQHINDDILKSMNRRSDSLMIKNRIEKIRSYTCSFTLRTSLIVGYPGETDEQFNELLKFLKDYPIDRVGAFSYSREEGTKAYNMPDQISDEIKDDRLNRLLTIQEQVNDELNKKKIGNTLSVIIDDYDEDIFMYIGRSQGEAPEVDEPILIASPDELDYGEFYNVIIKDAKQYNQIGEIADESC